ncbi:Aste57867_2568 [Aphanomyces stellatus]|uniref:Aste57867_2568 protein n=1 Tax=Aphanomyces stellatus TaxID=120398 RepID=A0A485KD09_9STRA|nr:hypothetical protein As57867_002561 [Aphanomyces stellatus]VFT79764.1 Aste57867_2568 [Aphanomyces stellatus]
MASNRLVWYCLVDGQGGAYRQTTTDFVNIPSPGFVAQLRKEVKKESGPALKEIAPSQLVVYANKVEFDKGPEKRVSLEVDSTIGTMGLSKREALYVVVSANVPDNGEWSAEELSTIHPQVQWKLWKSVVRIIVKDASVRINFSTALVVDRTSTHLYLLTNLHLFLGEEFTDALSSDFKKEIKRYSKLHPGKKANGKRKNESARDSGRSIRRTTRPTNAPVSYDITGIQIEIEQLISYEEGLKGVHEFSLVSDICWDCSATFDFAILKIPIPDDTQLKLVRCEMAFGVHATMHVHVYGFPGNLKDGKFDHQYAIIPAEITGTNRNQMTLSALSAPGLSGSAIVCTKRGIPVGYLGGGFDGSSKNEQYQSYGFTLHGIPQDLPSTLPCQDEEECKE